MRKPNKRESIWSVVLIVAVFYSVGLDRTVANKRRMNTRLRDDSRSAAAQSVGAETSPSETAVSRSAENSKMLLQSGFGSWNSDPFNRVFTLDVVAAPARGGAGEQQLELQGVVSTNRGRSAMIDNQAYQKGDRIGRFLVEEITPHSVLLKDLEDGSLLRLEVD